MQKQSWKLWFRVVSESGMDILVVSPSCLNSRVHTLFLSCGPRWGLLDGVSWPLFWGDEKVVSWVFLLGDKGVAAAWFSSKIRRLPLAGLIGPFSLRLCLGGEQRSDWGMLQRLSSPKERQDGEYLTKIKKGKQTIQYKQAWFLPSLFRGLRGCSLQTDRGGTAPASDFAWIRRSALTPVLAVFVLGNWMELWDLDLVLGMATRQNATL